jgi:hypothetical protein
MADTSEIDDWKTYWRINVLFHTKFLAKGEFKCIICGKAEISTSVMRSDFALSAAKCAERHVPLFQPSNMVGLCFDCDSNAVQKITLREQECFREGCRRKVLVDRDAIVRRLVGKKVPAVVDRCVHAESKETE